MSTSSWVLGLSVANLLLAAMGLLLVYFDWSAARRREFLYLYLSEEKPDANYFASARRRRAQHTRLLGAFVLLFVRQTLSVGISALVLRPREWAVWGQWWQARSLVELSAAPPLIETAARMQVWLLCIEMLALALLVIGFLYGARPDKLPTIDLMTVAWIALWSVFVLLAVSGIFGARVPLIVEWAVQTARVVLLGGALYGLFWHRPPPDPDAPTFAAAPRLLALAFGAWLLGPFLASLIRVPGLGAIGVFITYLILVSLIAREVLSEYETMESSRHRLGRERSVIFSFLQRIGAAFSTALDVDQVLKIILESGLETTEAQAGAIYLYDAESQTLTPRIVMNFFPPLHIDTPAALSDSRTEDLEAEMKRQVFALGEGIVGEVAESGQARLIEDVKAQEIMLGSTTDFMRNRSMLLVPLRVNDAPLGVMAVLNKNRGSFGPDDQSLLQALADQGALSINNAILTVEVGRQERLHRELQIARDIQQRLLPKSCPIVPGFEIGARGTSATEVGGDYYDFFWVDKDRLGIVIADVSGKGVHAALVVAMIKSAFRSVASGNFDVRDVLARVNEFMSEDLRRDMFITCVYGILDIPAHTFSWARAGHEPIIVTHPAAPTEMLSPEGFALGIIGGPEFIDLLEVQTVELKPGDKLLMFTDGLTEAMNSEGEEFGMQRILQVMEHPESAPPELPVVRSAKSNGKSSKGASQLHAGSAAPNGVNGAHSANGANGNPTADGSARQMPCTPDEPSNLRSIERAVQLHVGDAPQSDDLTIVYIAAT